MDRFNPESREQPQGVELRIIPPEGDKHHMVGFDAKTTEEAKAYNEVIEHYLGLKYSHIFHQVGGHDDIGYHAWEIWNDDVDIQWIQDQFSEIDKDARVLINEDDIGVVCEQVYDKWDEQKK